MGKIRNATGMDNTTGQFGISEKGDILLIPAIIGLSDTPTFVLSSAAGTGASFTIVGTNLGGKITITTGVSLLSTGVIGTLTFANGFAFPNGCIVNFSAMDSNFASVITKLFSNTTTSGVTINTSLALSLGTTYTGSYTVTGW